MSYTITEAGLILTETQEGVTFPADYSFATVNDYVHGVDRYFEELQWLALGMATEIEKLRLAEEGAKEAFGHVVQEKRDLEAECKRLRGLLAGAYDTIHQQAHRT